MKKRLHKFKKHLPKKSNTSMESPVYVGGMGAVNLAKPIGSKIVYINTAISRMDTGLQGTLVLRNNVLFKLI